MLLEFAFVNGIFPQNCTRAKIIPIHKKADKTSPNNYRPMSILNSFAKVFERLIYDRFLAFFKKHNVIHKTQYGFQKHTSTTHAVWDIVSTAYNNISQNLYPGLVFLDLQKAFDCVPHGILLGKLKYYGIRGPPNRLIETFFSRSRYTSINGIDSEIKPSNTDLQKAQLYDRYYFYFISTIFQTQLAASQDYSLMIPD